jgi:hypothetical protein
MSKDGMEAVMISKIYCSCPESNHKTPAVQDIAYPLYQAEVKQANGNELIVWLLTSHKGKSLRAVRSSNRHLAIAQYIYANKNEIMTNKCVVLGRCERDLCAVLTCNDVTISDVFRS